MSRAIFEIINLGKGKYGNGATPILPENLLPLNERSSQDVEEIVNQVVDDRLAFLDDLFLDGVVSVGTITQAGNNLTFGTDWKWRLNKLEVVNADSNIKAVPITSSGFTRIDIFVGNSAGQITRIEGSAVALPTVAVPPSTPVGTVSLIQVSVIDTGIQTITPLPVVDTYVRYDINNQNLAPVQRQNANNNLGNTNGVPQIINSIGTLNVTRTSNCLIFTGSGYTRVSTINAGYNGEEICIINRTGQVLDLDSVSGASPDGFLRDLGLINNAVIFLKYVTGINRWVPFVDLTRIVPSVAGGINDFPFVVYQNNGTTPILEVRSQGNVLVQGVGNAGQNNAALNVNQLPSGGGGDRPIIIARRETGANAWLLRNDGRIVQYSRSGATNESTRRDELYLNYSELVTTSGTINDLVVNASTKLLVLTAASNLNGIVLEDGRLIRIEARGVNVVIGNENVGSSVNNRFSIGSDLTINDGEVYQFLKINNRIRRVL